MVIPKKHYPYLFEMEGQAYLNLLSAAKKVAEILKKSFNPKSGKIGEIVYGLDVDHVHIHLVPIDRAGDLSFANAKPASKEELENTLSKIKEST